MLRITFFIKNISLGFILLFANYLFGQAGHFGAVTAHNSKGSRPTLTLTSTNTCADVNASPGLKTGTIRVRNMGSATRDNWNSNQSCFTLAEPNLSSMRNVWVSVSIAAGSGITGLYFYSSIAGVTPLPTSSTNLRNVNMGIYSGTATSSPCTPGTVCSTTWDNSITSYTISAPYIETLGTERVDVTPGNTYVIEFWTYTQGSDPNFNFDVHVVPLGARPANDLCTGALPYLNETGCNLGARPGCLSDDPSCAFTMENSVFYTITKPGTGAFSVTISNVFCVNGGATLQTAIYRATTGNCATNLNTVGNQIANRCFTGTYTYNISNADPPGTTYIMWFDGNAGAACTWGITVLPVEWSRFEVEEFEDAVGLFWETVTEKNSYYFDVERSTNDRDWISLGKVNGAGTSSIPRSYRFLDELPKFGINYYRIKQVDFDGEYTYSDVKAIDFNRKKEQLIVPNPNDGKFLLTAIKKNSLIEIRSLSGQLVYSLKSENANEIIELENIETGMYLLSVDGEYLDKFVVR